MSAEEFAEWGCMFTAEQLHPAVDVARQAQLLAALHNGPLQRRGKRLWDEGQFVPNDPWAPARPARRKQPTSTELAAQVRAINRSRHRH